MQACGHLFSWLDNIGGDGGNGEDGTKIDGPASDANDLD